MSSPFMLPVEDDPFNFARYAAPYPNYRRVRETSPVYWSQLLGGWVLTRHADVKAALVDKRLSAARARDAQSAQLSEGLRGLLAPVDELLRRWALFQDNPEHRRIRQALSGAFTASLMEQLRQRVQVIADGLIDAARGRGEMDLVADFALRLPAMVIAELLGMSRGGWRQARSPPPSTVGRWPSQERAAWPLERPHLAGSRALPAPDRPSSADRCRRDRCAARAAATDPAGALATAVIADTALDALQVRVGGDLGDLLDRLAGEDELLAEFLLHEDGLQEESAGPPGLSPGLGPLPLL